MPSKEIESIDLTAERVVDWVRKHGGEALELGFPSYNSTSDIQLWGYIVNGEPLVIRRTKTSWRQVGFNCGGMLKTELFCSNNHAADEDLAGIVGGFTKEPQPDGSRA